MQFVMVSGWNILPFSCLHDLWSGDNNLSAKILAVHAICERFRMEYSAIFLPP
jgi:hypothetical protein